MTLTNPQKTQTDALPARQDGYIDLHLHTTHSDGVLLPEQVIQLAVAQGLRAIAITDHDTVSGIPEALRAAAQHGLECIPGVEISACDHDYGEIHLLGYFVNPANAVFLSALQRQKTVRLNRILRMIERLQELGVDISFEMIRAQAEKSDVLGRPHLAQTLVQQGVVASMEEAFHQYLGRGRPAFIPKVGLSFQEAIQVVEAAGGITIYAHPGLTRKDHLIPYLLKLGVRGLEVYHSEHSPQDVARYAEMVAAYGIVATGGSDCHGGRKNKPILIGSVAVPYHVLETLQSIAGQPGC